VFSATHEAVKYERRRSTILAEEAQERENFKKAAMDAARTAGVETGCDKEGASDAEQSKPFMPCLFEAEDEAAVAVAGGGGGNDDGAMKVVDVEDATGTIPISETKSGRDAGAMALKDDENKLPTLTTLFVGEQGLILRGTSGLKASDLERAHKLLIEAGCTTTGDLICFLDENKLPGYREEETASSSSGGGGGPPRVAAAGAWCGCLTQLGVLPFHAMKIIMYLRPYLK